MFVEPETPLPVPIERFGVIWEGLKWIPARYNPGHSLSHILGPAGVSAGAITNLANETKSTYDVRNIRAQQPYWIAFDEDSVQPARYFVYQRNATQYARFDLRPPYGVTLEPLPHRHPH